MIVGAMNSPLRPVTEEIHALADLGVDYLELCLDPPAAAPDTVRALSDAIRAALTETGLAMPVAHLPTFVWLADVYDSVRQASVAEVVRALAVCHEFQIPKAVLHPGYLTGLLRMDPGRGRDLAWETLRTIIEEAERLGVVICLENMFPKSGHMYRPEEFAAVLERFPTVMMAIDLAHAYVNGSKERMLRLIEIGGRRIRHVHVSDNSGRDDDHLPIGVGRVDVAAGLTTLKQMGYNDTITLEVFAPDRDYLGLSLTKIRAIWEGM